ncbi:MAG: ABC transporter permease [Xenophilus sp.]
MPLTAPTLWRRFVCQPGALPALLFFTAVAALAVAAPWLYARSPWRMTAAPLLPPLQQWALPLGSDMLGRDIAAGVVHGARASLLAGLVSTGLALMIGVPAGALAGYAGGRTDRVLSAAIECFQAVPQFAMAVVLVAIAGPALPTIIGAIALVSWPPVARLVRTEIMSLRERDFVAAARIAGERSWRILCGQILPNAMSPIAVCASFMVATAMLTESALAFLGLGDPKLMSWGFMLGAGRTVMREAWWLCVWPGLALAATVLSINVATEALHRALHPGTAAFTPQQGGGRTA